MKVLDFEYCESDSGGHGTTAIEGEVVETVCEVIERANLLVYVRTLRAKYKLDFGDIIVGRVLERRRTAVDELNMRRILKRMMSSVNPSSNPTPSTNPNPKDRNRRRSKQRIKEFNLDELSPPIVMMVDQRTMAQLLQAPTEGYKDAIVVPAITADNFKLKHGLFTLKEPPRSIFTWDDLVSKFINQFFPPSKTTNLRNEITNFQQRFDESFSEACDRFKDLLRACPHYGFLELHQLDTFYNALNSKDQDSLSSIAGGNFLDKMPRKCLAIIESKSKVRYSHNKPVVAKVSTNTSTSGVSYDVVELKDMVKALLLDKKSQNQSLAPVKAVEESCVTCGGAHSYRYCPATDDNVYRDNIQEFISQASAVNYNQGNTSYRPPMMSNQIRPPGFPPVPNNQNAQLNQRNNQNRFIPNQNRGNNFNQGPVYQPPVKTCKINLTNLTDLITKFVNSNSASTSSLGTLPSNIIANPISDLKAITTRSGVSYDGPQILPSPSFLPTVVENKPEATKGTMNPTNNGSTKDVQPQVVHSKSPILTSEPVTSPIFEPVIAPVSASKPNPKSLIPYPSRRNNERNREKANNQIEKFYQIFKDMSFEISFADALILMPKFASTLKALIGNKEKLSEIARTPLNEYCSVVLFKKLPEKLGDSGKFLIPCDFLGMAECLALANFGASINLMPFSVWIRHSVPDLTPMCMTIELSDHSISRSVGVAEDVYVKVGSFHFSADFVVVDFDADPRVPLILERSFLKIGRALIDVFECELTLRVGKEAITFNLDQTSRYSANYSDMTAKRIDVIDMACEEYSQQVLGFSDVIARGNPTYYYDLIVSTTSPTLTPFENSDFLLEEVDAFLAIKDEHTSPEFYQPYLDPEGDILLLEAFLNDDPSLPPPNQENYLPEVRKELKICEAKFDKSSVDEPPKVKLKDLPPHLEYAFLEGDDKLPIIIAKDLSVEEKTALITVLKSYKQAIACKLSDIKGIEPELSNRRLLKNSQADDPTSLKRYPFIFSKECVEAFQTLKRKLTEAPILIAPDQDMPFELMCNASDFAIGVVLGKRQDKHFRPINYASKTMTEAKSNYTTTENGMLAVVYAFEKFRSNLIMNKSIVYTDHSALKYLFSKKDLKARLLQWVILLHEFTFKVIDTKGAENLAANHLSRLENPHQNALDPKEINESFPLETFNLVSTRSNQSENRTSWSDKLDDALWAFRTTYKTLTGCTPYKLVYGKACHLPIELEHKAYWALKHANFNLKTAELDMSNISTTYRVPSTPNTGIHKDYSLDHVIGDVQSGVQTRRMTKTTNKQGFISVVYEEKAHEDLHICLFACFLSQEESKKVWTLVDLPYGKTAIGTKWIYRNKKDERGIVVGNKARLVAQGYTQEEGIDYDKVFAPVARIKVIRLFLAYASFKDFVVYQMDVKSAFMYGKIEEEVYVCQTLGFKDPEFPHKVYKVEKHYMVYIKLLELEMCIEFEKMMHKKFHMSSMGELTFFLGLQVTQKDDGIFISRDKYVDEILKKFGFSTVKTASTPMKTAKPLFKDTEAEDVDVHLYRSMIGSLMYLTALRHDIMFAACACARFQVTPKLSHLHAVKRIFRYLKGQPKLGLWKSTTGGCQFLGSRLISWQCKKQTMVANSITEAEYVAAASCCGQILWIQNQMLDYGYNFINTKIFIDNESTIDIC
nr:reverse transcriptase domain-containing protein [Tanacetum cinerariifolium]